MKITYLTPQVQVLILETNGMIMGSFDSGTSSGQSLTFDGSEDSFDSFFGS